MVIILFRCLLLGYILDRILDTLEVSISIGIPVFDVQIIFYFLLVLITADTLIDTIDLLLSLPTAAQVCSNVRLAINAEVDQIGGLVGAKRGSSCHLD